MSQSLREEIEGVVRNAKDCPNCDNSGFTVIQTSERCYVTRDMASDAGDLSLEGSLYSDDEFEQEQCQWCYETPNSKFNLADAILAKIVERLPKEKRINCCDLNITDDGYRKQGWNDCLITLKHLLSEEKK